MRETRFKDGFECPHCVSEHVVRFCKVNGRQRYRCKNCRKTFTDTTNTVLYRTRKGDEWITFVDCMFKGYSLRKSAEIVGVTWVTLFYWRHKLLSALNQMDCDHFEGIVEVDETYFLYSQKGQRGITERKPRKAWRKIQTQRNQSRTSLRSCCKRPNSNCLQIFLYGSYSEAKS